MREKQVNTIASRIYMVYCLNRNDLHRFIYLNVCLLRSGGPYKRLGDGPCWGRYDLVGDVTGVDFEVSRQNQRFSLFLLPSDLDVKLSAILQHIVCLRGPSVTTINYMDETSKTINRSQVNAFFYKICHDHGVFSQQ